LNISIETLLLRRILTIRPRFRLLTQSRDSKSPGAPVVHVFPRGVHGTGPVLVSC